jgi:hypothetical protein
MKREKYLYSAADEKIQAQRMKAMRASSAKIMKAKKA